VAQENGAEFGMRLQPGGQIHFAADDGVFHAVFTAEISG
jgi:hypothetical protein